MQSCQLARTTAAQEHPDACATKHAPTSTAKPTLTTENTASTGNALDAPAPKAHGGDHQAIASQAMDQEDQDANSDQSVIRTINESEKSHKKNFYKSVAARWECMRSRTRNK